MKENRRGILASLLGGSANADTALKAAEEAEQQLDGAGVARKEADAATLLSQNIAAALAAAGVTLPETAVETILAQVNAAVAPPADAAPATPPAEMPMPSEVEEQKAKSMPENAASGVNPADLASARGASSAPDALATLVQQQSDYISKATKDMGDIAQIVVQMGQRLETFAPLGDAVKSLSGRLDEIEKQLKERPRAASRAEETVIKQEEVEKKIKQSTEGTKVILGIPVRD